MSANPRHRWTPEEYLAYERASDSKHEYVDGEIFDMVGGSHRHSLIISNTIIALGSQLLNGPCYVFQNDLRVRTPQSKMHTYPDVSIVCGEPEFLGEDTLLNPTVLIEVLSPSTGDYDRGKKFGYYREFPSLQHYVLIAQSKPLVEHFPRSPDGAWKLLEVRGLDAHIDLPSIGCTLAFSDVYNKVKFEDQ